MQQLATSWLVYRMTGSPLWLGISAFSSMIPMFLFGLFAGVFVDRMNQHRVLIWTQSLAAVQALILAVLTFTGKITLAELISLNLVLGVINCFDMATRQAFVVQMLEDKSDLTNAIAVNSTVMNGTRLIGPALAGVAISLLGEGWCFLLNSLSYIAVLGALIAMSVPRQTHHHEGTKLLESLKIGFNFTLRNDSIRRVLFLLAFISMFGLPYNTLFPALAKKIAGGDANALDLITGSAAAGALLGALYLTRKTGAPLLGKVIGYASVLFSFSLILLAGTQTYFFMLPCVFLTGVGMMLMLASGNTVIQYLVKNEMRGRVMSFFNFSLLGITPFGSLLLGVIAQRIGITPSLYVNGTVCLIGSIIFLRHGPKINQHVAAQNAS
jgi:MFS family permease